MAKATAEIRSLARAHTATAIKVLQNIASSSKAPAAARVTAIKELLDRGWGKAVQPIAGADGESPLVIQVIKLADNPDTE